MIVYGSESKTEKCCRFVPTCLQCMENLRGIKAFLFEDLEQILVEDSTWIFARLQTLLKGLLTNAPKIRNITSK